VRVGCINELKYLVPEKPCKLLKSHFVSLSVSSQNVAGSSTSYCVSLSSFVHTPLDYVALHLASQIHKSGQYHLASLR